MHLRDLGLELYFGRVSDSSAQADARGVVSQVCSKEFCGFPSMDLYLAFVTPRGQDNVAVGKWALAAYAADPCYGIHTAL